jgi:cell shape-determining protein MreC
MSYRYDKTQQKKKRLRLLVVVVFVLMVLSPFPRILFNAVDRSVMNFENGIHTNLNIFQRIISSWHNKQALVAENDSLRKRIDLLEISNLRIDYLERELENRLEVADSAEIQARVVSHTFMDRDIITIDAGSLAGINEGDYVVYGDVSLGIIVEVNEHSSRVQLYSQNDVVTEAVLDDGSFMNLQGMGNGSFLLDLSRDIVVDEGELLFSPRDGRLIAVVRHVEFDPRNTFQDVLLSYPINIRKLRYVGVIKNNLGI